MSRNYVYDERTEMTLKIYGSMLPSEEPETEDNACITRKPTAEELAGYEEALRNRKTRREEVFISDEEREEAEFIRYSERVLWKRKMKKREGVLV